MSIIGAIVAGLAGTIVMSIALAGAPQMGMPKIDFVGMLGAMFSPQANRVLGWIMHLLIGVIFGLIYAAIWSLGIGSADVTIGLLFGIVHWLVAGLLIGLLPTVNAGMRAGTVKAPGRYLLQLGNMGFFGGLMGHILFGLTVGLVYGIFKL
jgi:hypothetical protein